MASVPDDNSSTSLGSPVKITLFFDRASDISPTEFKEQWQPWLPTDAHDRAEFATAAPGLERYSRNIAIASVPIAGAPIEYVDVVEEFWFKSLESAQDFFGSETMTSQLWPRRETHLRSGVIRMMAGTPNLVRDQPSNPQDDAVKMILVSARRPGMTREEYFDYWLNHHWPLAAAGPEGSTGQRVEHLPSTVEPFPGFEGSPFDSSVTLSCDSASVLAEAFNGPYYEEVLRPDEPNFVDRNKAVGVMASEIVVFDRNA
ncbi:EthD domain-containing protein [Streptomyces sp. NPDC003832]